MVVVDIVVAKCETVLEMMLMAVSEVARSLLLGLEFCPLVQPFQVLVVVSGDMWKTTM